jgi:quercetin dioxygenase-like cupin family protein
MRENAMDRPRGFVVDETSCPLEGWNDALRGMVVWRTLLSGDRTPTSQLTLGVTELGPGQPSPFHPHRHAQSEIYYVLSGEGVVQIEGEEHRLRAGTSAFIPGDAWHGARNTGGEPLRLLYVFAADSFGDVKYVFPAVAAERSPS